MVVLGLRCGNGLPHSLWVHCCVGMDNLCGYGLVWFWSSSDRVALNSDGVLSRYLSSSFLRLGDEDGVNVLNFIDVLKSTLCLSTLRRLFIL